jgi:AcrR family transcriptional regulator
MENSVVVADTLSGVATDGEQPESRLQEIRTAAVRLFAERGYRATTMDDIGREVGIRGPSLYKHLESKEQLLYDLTMSTLGRLHECHNAAIAGVTDVVEQLKRAVEAHVRYHARNRMETFVLVRELRSVEGPRRLDINQLSHDYGARFKEIIDRGIGEGRFTVGSSRLAMYSILDMGMGISTWYRADGELSEDEIVNQYSAFALRMVGVVYHSDPSNSPPAPTLI